VEGGVLFPTGCTDFRDTNMTLMSMIFYGFVQRADRVWHEGRVAGILLYSMTKQLPLLPCFHVSISVTLNSYPL